MSAVARAGVDATLTPLIYTQIAIIAGISWLFFGQLPDGWGGARRATSGLCGDR